MSFDPKTMPPDARDAFQYGALAWPLVVQESIKGGITDADELADIVFFLHHPERNGRPLEASERTLIEQWKAFRGLVKPLADRAPRSKPAPKADRHVPVDLFALQYSRKIDGTPEFPRALANRWGDDDRWVEISTVGDLVSLVRRRCGAEGYVRSLRLGGHGSSSSFRLGTTSVNLQNISVVATQLQEIVPYFRPGHSVVRLDHCNVGQDRALLKKVAKAFGGVAVVAPNSNQYTNEGEPAFEGDGTICGPNNCVRLPFPNMRARDLLETIHLYFDPVYENEWSWKHGT